MIDTDKGRAEVSRFAVDLAIRIALIAGVVWLSLVLLSPIMPLMAWAVILAVAVHPAFAVLRGRLRLHRGLAATIGSGWGARRASRSANRSNRNHIRKIVTITPASTSPPRVPKTSR